MCFHWLDQHFHLSTGRFYQLFVLWIAVLVKLESGWISPWSKCSKWTCIFFSLQNACDLRLPKWSWQIATLPKCICCKHPQKFLFKPSTLADPVFLLNWNWIPISSTWLLRIEFDQTALNSPKHISQDRILEATKLWKSERDSQDKIKVSLYFNESCGLDNFIFTIYVYSAEAF